MKQIARTPKQIGAVIRRARRQQELSQGALGGKTGLRQETLSKIENGNPATRIESICDVLAGLGLELVVRPRSRGEADRIEDIF